METTDIATSGIDRVWEEALENGEVDVIDEVLASDYVGHTPGAPRGIRGPDAFKQYILTLREAFPDIWVAIDDRLVTDDAVVDRYTMGGTHEGEFNGVRPTGNEIEFSGIAIHYVEDGKIVKDVSEFDVLYVMDQLGVIEPPGDASP